MYDQIKRNHQITAKELRILDESGENLGVMTKEAALKAALEKGLDLIEISPKANPPVARIMSFDKFRYNEEKKRKRERALQKTQEHKQVQISVREARHDLEIKAGKVDDFLTKGHSVAIVMVLRGREKANKDWAKLKLEEFTKLISVPHQRTMEPRWSGRGFTMQVGKNK